MGVILVKDMPKKSCSDCDAEPGQEHFDGCDIERCTDCDLQRLSCECPDHEDYRKEIYSGVAWERTLLLAEENNLFCKWDNGWVKCDKDDEGAIHDLNEATRLLFNKNIK